MSLAARRPWRAGSTCFKRVRLYSSSGDKGATQPRPSSTPAPDSRPKMTASTVPSSSLGRIFHYGNLAASLAGGVAAEFVRQNTAPASSASSSSSSASSGPSGLLLTEANVNRLVDKLSQMRGAALKLGQFLSIQAKLHPSRRHVADPVCGDPRAIVVADCSGDGGLASRFLRLFLSIFHAHVFTDAHVLPPEVERIFRRVQDRAHYMPNWQMEQVMREDLGADWQQLFSSFDRLPFASASIGQVHLATLRESGQKVAVKVQFPNVAQSIGADLAAIGLLLPAARLLPRGLHLERNMRILGQEVEDECNYLREAAWARKFRQWVHEDGVDVGGGALKVQVPWVWEGSTRRVLVMEFVEGVSVGGETVQRLPQEEKDLIASTIVSLCLHELFVFRAMQTDPNWTNFLYDGSTRQLGLVDFGATREYGRQFIDDWLRLLRAAVAQDEAECVRMSMKLGYLTGEEDEVMRAAHVRSMVLLGVPFRAQDKFSFARADGTWPAIAAEIRSHIPTMLQRRLAPPPRETLSLNRKLSGAFLLAARLDARVDCRALWHRVTDSYTFADEGTDK